MTATEKKISVFCARHGLAYEWQALKCNGRRAVVESIDRQQHAATLDAARRLKGIRVKDWTCGDGGVWEGRVYFQDAADAERIEAIFETERQRNENWCMVYHNCINDGMDSTAAARRAEALYHTPATL